MAEGDKRRQVTFEEDVRLRGRRQFYGPRPDPETGEIMPGDTVWLEAEEAARVVGAGWARDTRTGDKGERVEGMVAIEPDASEVSGSG